MLCVAVELRLEGNPLRRPRIQVLVEEGLEGLKKWCNGEVEVNAGLRNRSRQLNILPCAFRFDDVMSARVLCSNCHPIH
jgi:hypothetical protein